MPEKISVSRFTRQALVRMPGFVNTSTFFYSNSFEHILNGFCCEITPRGMYIWRFFYPLYDPFGSLNLLYSYRLQGDRGYISFELTEFAHLIDEFAVRVFEYLEEARTRLTVNQFCSLFVDRPQLCRNPHAEMILGYSKILLGEEVAAKEHLKSAYAQLGSPYMENCGLILKLTDVDLRQAQEAILNFEDEARIKIRAPLRGKAGGSDGVNF